MLTDLKKIIDQVSRDKGFDREILVEALESAVLTAAHKKFGMRRDLDVRFNEELGEIELFQFRMVVEEVLDEQTEVSFAEAKALDPEVELGDELGSKMDDVADLGRVAAQSAKQVIIQKMKDAERDVIFNMYKDREGEIVNGIVQRFDRGNMVVNLGRTDALLPKKEMMPRRSYRQGDRVRAMLKEVRENARDHQLILTRISSDFLVKLFALEVSEISEGIVQIVHAVREPGARSKIAVVSNETDVDPVGACVGMKGSRVQNVVQELQGEKIDIVPWSPDPAKFVANALSPAQISMVLVDEDNKSLLVVVPDDQLSLAIGRGGQNVRLASMLLNWRIDVKSEERYAKHSLPGFQSLKMVPGLKDRDADTLFDGGITHLDKLKEADNETLMELLKWEENQVVAIKELASPLQYTPEDEDELLEDDGGEDAGAEAAPSAETEEPAAALDDTSEAEQEDIEEAGAEGSNEEVQGEETVLEHDEAAEEKQD
ncbi:MAG: transcription termination factor NusA [Desulfobulbaceae bacterium]|jgi:N utilization substance protein A|nr:transcription termination factor NusA [Desulfobulbaceae bacterium]